MVVSVRLIVVVVQIRMIGVRMVIVRQMVMIIQMMRMTGVVCAAQFAQAQIDRSVR